MHRRFFPRTLLAAALLAASTASLDAAASGFSTARFGGEHGNPVAMNPTVLYYNPGALSSYPGIQIMADGNLAYRIMSYERTGGSEPPCVADNTCPPANNGKAELSNFAAAPMLGASVGIPLGEHRLSLGAGFFVPFGGNASWKKNEAWDREPVPNDPTYFPGPVDGQQRWFSIDGTIRTLYISGGVAFSIFDKVHLGVSGGAAINEADTVRARNAAGVSDDVTQEGRAWLSTKGTGAQLGAGVLVTPLERVEQLRIGVSYQAPPGLTKDGQVQTGLLARNLGGQITGLTEAEEVELHQQMPHVIRWGAAFRPLDALELRLHGDVHTWSTFKDQCVAPKGEPCEVNEDGSNQDSPNILANIPRRWNDAFGIRFGLSYWAVPEVEVFAGVGYDSNAVPDATIDPALNDFHDVGAALGARFRPIKQLIAGISYNHFFYVPRTIEDGGTDAFEGSSAGPDNGGRYEQILGFVNIHVIGKFDPFVDDPEAAAER